jgi:vacuolar-type H+-ATPase catalytic subunit A/Vma1
MEEVVRYKELRVRIPADLHTVLKEISEKTGVPMSKIVEYALDQYVMSIIKEDLPLELKVMYIVRKILDITQLQQRIDIAASVSRSEPLVKDGNILPIIYELQKVKERLYGELIDTAKKVEDKIQKDLAEVERFTRFVERIQLREWRMRERTREVVESVVDTLKRKESKEKGEE